ncbi:type II toxin-antitoxin system RelE/ParE family toxin [Devosia salina]|uniref:Toxin n=1 Tax=Devosia salina TaxID=2860336 RepID=A0ABX8W8D5_9HYPH|nr:type II toxin-antitoxin system RelE/ParE family toxin [Devosia salina]QYO75220.1 type II toxin-antitoxin system RelE/ParE family toxin [Devosia salina]
MRHEISRAAEADLKDIFLYTLETFGSRQAQRYLRDLGAVFEMLGDFPELGRTFEADSRSFIHGSHIVIYRVEDDVVLIGRVLHGARDRSDP